MTSGPSYSVKTNINPSSFRGPIELFDLSQLNELVKFMGFNKVMPVITKLHMKKHSRKTKATFMPAAHLFLQGHFTVFSTV
jgi:hypothetical protein